MTVAEQDLEVLPGQDLDQDVASWLEQHEGYDSVELNKSIPPKRGGSSYEIDVYATHRDPRSMKTAKAGAVVYLAVVVIYALGLTELQQTFEGVVQAVAPGLAGSAFLVFLVMGGWIAAYNIRRLETRTYVECRDWEMKVGRPVVSRVGGRMQGYGDKERRASGREKASTSPPWKPPASTVLHATCPRPVALSKSCFRRR